MIKKYNQFVNDNKQNKFNENIEDFNHDVDQSFDSEFDNDDVDHDFDHIENSIDNSDMGEDEMEEEGGQYIGQKMMQDLADKLDIAIESDGSINYDGKKINFFSETEMFHVDGKKFKTDTEVIDYLNSSLIDKDDDLESSEDQNDQETMDYEMEDEKFESKSYKHTRFRNFKNQ